jgi:hypothetical protein
MDFEFAKQQRKVKFRLNEFSICISQYVFLFSIVFRLALAPTHPLHCILWAVSPAIKWLGHKVDQCWDDEWSCIFTPPVCLNGELHVAQLVLRLDDWGVVRFLIGSRIFVYPYRPDLLGVRRTSSPVGTGGSFPGHGADHSPSTNAKVKKTWVYTSTAHTSSWCSA